jgi:hypothetical protein
VRVQEEETKYSYSKKTPSIEGVFHIVPEERLELSWVAPLAPKASVSTIPPSRPSSSFQSSYTMLACSPQLVNKRLTSSVRGALSSYSP